MRGRRRTRLLSEARGGAGLRGAGRCEVGWSCSTGAAGGRAGGRGGGCSGPRERQRPTGSAGLDEAVEALLRGQKLFLQLPLALLEVGGGEGESESQGIKWTQRVHSTIKAAESEACGGAFLGLGVEGKGRKGCEARRQRYHALSASREGGSPGCGARGREGGGEGYVPHPRRGGKHKGRDCSRDGSTARPARLTSRAMCA